MELVIGFGSQWKWNLLHLGQVELINSRWLEEFLDHHPNEIEETLNFCYVETIVVGVKNSSVQ